MRSSHTYQDSDHLIVGIDLGTTNSLIGAFIGDSPRLFSNALGELLTPSVVSIDDEGNVTVGQAARDRLTTHPERSVAAFKRWMGSPRETVLAGKSYRPEQLSALVLKSLIADAEAATGEKVTEAVISVPAYFSDAQRKATRIAGELAGIKVDRLINEPTAAALAYGLQHRPDGGRFLVFDLGGGTLDVSIIEMFEGVVEVHASAGDNFLGGEDFRDLLQATVLSEMKLDSAALPASDLARLRRRLDELKHSLTNDATARLDITLADKPLTWSITEQRFTELAEPLILRLRAPLERAMRDAKLSPDQLDEVVLVGGASRMPLVARTVSRLLSRLPLRHVNPDQAIAMGAVVASGMKARNAALEETILTDVCPYTLGIEISKIESSGNQREGYFLPIIQRNSTVPVSREEQVWPMHSGQKVINVKVFQGESPMVAKNTQLGALRVPLPQTDNEDDRSALVRFTYDINGLLQVSVKVRGTGKEHELVLEQNPGVLSPDEIRVRLAALSHLKVHPRDKQENLALIARAERLYEEYVDARERLQMMMVHFRETLDSQDERRIVDDRQQFTEALNGIERG
jgi:molecular chaperone HscC